MPNLSAQRQRGPLAAILDLFSSVWLGVILLVLLFIYCSVGSAMPLVRQMPLFEMTEFEWFCWWPFTLLIVLICINIVVATIRRIPFNALTAGVWMIHAGILILSAGSIWYFTAKVEGDTLVVRRRVIVQTPGSERLVLPAIPGASAAAGDGAYQVYVYAIDPNWELLSAGHEGETAYKVSLLVESAERTFLRELIAGLPELTEDLVETGDPQQPVARAVKALGRPLVDENIRISLEYSPQEYFYIRDTASIYIREAGTDRWIERPVEGLPRYNDRISSFDHVWFTPGGTVGMLPDTAGVGVTVPAFAEDDPLPDLTFTVTDYLRYAIDQARYVSGGDQLMPLVEARIETADGLSSEFTLRAFDPARSTDPSGVVSLVWINTEAELAEMRRIEPPALRITSPDGSIDLTSPIEVAAAGDPDAPFTPIEGTDYSYRVRDTMRDQVIGGNLVSVAFLEIRRGEVLFNRWAFDDPSLNRDFASEGGMGRGGELDYDDAIQTEFLPGRMPPAPITIVCGPDPDALRAILAADLKETTIYELTVGERTELRNGVSLTVTGFSSHGRDEVRPLIVPATQRVRGADVLYSQIRITSEDGGAVQSNWLAYNNYVFDDADSAPGRFPYRSRFITAEDGRQYELVYSRSRRKLPETIVLDDFLVDTHIGGYTGANTSIRNWTSMMRFAESEDYGEPTAVSVNDPIGRKGLWYFQSGWDPPEEPRFAGDPGSTGFNYTVLGVANREGVWIQLAGCCITVIGLIYAFYIKPLIRRRRAAAPGGAGEVRP